jgi:iron complex transport system ATP-binding protein
MRALAVERVSFGYRPEVPTLRSITLQVLNGEFLTLVGPNGSGKTTLLRLLDRIYVPNSGRILLNDRDIASYSRVELARRIAFVPQDPITQFPFTVLEIVLMGRSPHSRGRAFENPQDRATALDMLALTDVAHLAHQPITALSGGERQRVFIARALAQQPGILLLDEPNAHLDIAHQVDIFELIRKLNRESGLTVVSVSHELNLAAAYCDRIAMLVCGEIIAAGPPEEVLTEKRITEVFRTPVLVDTHPTRNTPRVTLLPPAQPHMLRTPLDHQGDTT